MNIFKRKHFVTIFCIGFVSILNAQSFEHKKLLLRTENYDIDIKVDYEDKKLISTCKLTVTNPSNEEIKTIPLILYRLMKVTSVKNEKEEQLVFAQQILSFDDWDVYQVNFIEIQLEKPILKGETKTITIDYSGYLLGYTETGMSYVQDKISPEFTIIRPDCNAYPTLGYPSFEINDAIGFEAFNYKVNVTVPDSLVVANGGKLLNLVKKDGFSTYSYKNTKKAWRIDLAIAKYNIIEAEKLKIFYFPKDSLGANRIMQASKKAFTLYSQWWGKLNDNSGFAIIEIPEGWGAQADVSSIIQPSNAFRNKNQSTKLYHEISHLWNVKPTEISPSRWNEGLAMFIQYKTVEKIENKYTELNKYTEEYLNLIRNSAEYDKIPLIDYGKKNVTNCSYITGMLLFHVFYKLVGEQNFNKIIAAFYKKYYKKGASIEDFMSMANDMSSINLTDFFNDWVYTTKYALLIKKEYSIEKFVKHYK